jgi:hypothetical protein
VAVPTAFLYDTKSYIEAFIHEFRDENHAWPQIEHDTKSCIHRLSSGREISCKIPNRAWSEIVHDKKSAWYQIMHDHKSCMESCKTSNLTWLEIVYDMKSAHVRLQIEHDLKSCDVNPCATSNRARYQIEHDVKSCVTRNLHDIKSCMTENHAWLQI